MRPSVALATCREQVIGLAAACCARNVRVFGSAVKGLDREGSDLDLCTERELHPALKDRILTEARPL